jgi:hypothetical protein
VQHRWVGTTGDALGKAADWERPGAKPDLSSNADTEGEQPSLAPLPPPVASHLVKVQLASPRMQPMRPRGLTNGIGKRRAMYLCTRPRAAALANRLGLRNEALAGYDFHSAPSTKPNAAATASVAMG